MRESYQHSDGLGMLSVVEPFKSRPKPSESGTNEAQAEANRLRCTTLPRVGYV